MDPIIRGLILGGSALFLAVAATILLGGAMERHARDTVDETYSPTRETTVDHLGWPSNESTPDRDDAAPRNGANQPG
jgi:hypothetical protein